MDFLKKLLSGGKSQPRQVQQPMRQPAQGQQLRVQQDRAGNYPISQIAPGVVRQGIQPFGHGQEDDYTPSAALENTGYYNPQTTQHGAFRQGSFQNPQQQNDLLRKLLGY